MLPPGCRRRRWGACSWWDARCTQDDWELTGPDLFNLPQCAEEAAKVGKGPDKQKCSSLASGGL
jgi:hypothetical protein